MTSPASTAPSPSETGIGRTLVVEHLQVAYGGAVAVRDVSLSVPPGALVVLLGRNGAGKTTTLRALTGLLPSDGARITGGSVRFGDRAIARRAPHRIARAGIALVPERTKIFRTLTVRDNLRTVQPGRGRQERAGMDLIYELFPVLKERQDQVAGYLSGGEVQMLAISKALLLQPDVLVADEVSLGIAPFLVHVLLDALRRINVETGMSVLLAEQNAAAALEMADYGYVLENGVVAHEGPASELREHDTLRELYLGTGETAGYVDTAKSKRRA